MAATERNLKAAVEEYLTELRRIRATGGGTGELSYYPPLSNLLNAVGGSLRPRVYCVSQLAQQGAGHPDFGLYAARQVSKGQPKQGQTPEGGVVEVKRAGDDAWLIADSAQVSRYWELYRLALVTNTRDFVLLAETRRATRPSWRPSGWPTPPPTSRLSYNTPAPSPTASARRWPSTWAAPCPTGRRWRNPATWPGCWPLTPGTAWPGSRHRATHLR